MGVFSWRFPDLMREENRRFLMRDNPGSAYVQALAETGAAGFLLTAFFVVSLGALALRRAREKDVLVGGAGSGHCRLPRWLSPSAPTGLLPTCLFSSSSWRRSWLAPRPREPRTV